MNSHFCGRGVVYWCIADAVAIAGAIAWPGWLLPILTWLALVAMLVLAGFGPVRQRN